MKHMMILALAGATGTLLRYHVLMLFGDRHFPWGTFAVNVIGSFLMGFAFVLITEKALIDVSLKPYIKTAFLGAFTTFSTFSLDTFRLIQAGDWYIAVAYVFASVLTCLLALSLAVAISRAVF